MLNARLADPHLCEGRGMLECRPHGFGRLLNDAIEELEVERGRSARDRFEQTFRAHIGEWRIMRMNAVNGDALGRGVRGLRQRLAPGEVGVIPHIAPVHNAQYDGGGGAEQNDA